jgi:hypothetical protein
MTDDAITNQPVVIDNVRIYLNFTNLIKFDTFSLQMQIRPQNSDQRIINNIF